MSLYRLLFIILITIQILHDTTHAQARAADSIGINLSTTPGSQKIRSYNDFLRLSSVSKGGLFTVHRIEDKVFLEIPPRLLNTDILIISRIVTGAEDGINLYAGDEVGNMVVRFEKKSATKILLRKIQHTRYSGDTTSGMYANVIRSGLSPLMASFNVEAYGLDSSFVINVTDLFLGDNEGFSLSRILKSINGVSSLDKEKSYMDSVFTFPSNTEIHMVKTYVRSASTTQDSRSVSVEINSSLILLPKDLMRQRLADERVGYFSLRQENYDGLYPGVSERNFIKRWKLEPKVGDREKYLKGVLIEPEKPIVFYVDPTTPKKWIPYIIKGVNDWQQAFEQAGFKNAIFGKAAPGKEEDSSWSLYDASHSAIVYKPSPEQNASGPSITDPRTGEILESHINFHHNVLSLVNRWYMLQCGALDPAARKMVFDDTLMGELIRKIICHEVGHALGLRHNMGASSTVPVENLRDKDWLKENGICPSIMDYARFNYVAQPQDSIPQSELISRIGIYDKWVIEWGYRWYPHFSTQEAEAEYLNKWVNVKLKDHRLWYGPESNIGDPRIQVENLGDNAVVASNYGIMNLKRVIPNLINWTKVANSGYWNLQSCYYYAQSQFREYMLHVIDYIGGIEETIKHSDQGGGVYLPVNALMQKDAVAFLDKHLFHTPLWLADTAILFRSGDTRLGTISRVQEWGLSALINITRFSSMLSRNESTFGTNTYTLTELLKDLENSVWKELDKGEKIDLFRRSLQELYLLKMIEVYKTGNTMNYIRLSVSNIQIPLYNEEVKSIVAGHLRTLQKRISGSIRYVKDEATASYLKFIEKEISRVWK